MVAARIRLCRIDRRLLGGDDHFVGLPIEFDEEVSCADAVIIVDENSGYLPRNASGHEGHVAIHVGIISRDGVESFLNPWNAERGDDCQKEGDERPNQQRLPQEFSLRRVLVFWA